jgi:hypothetical protein
MGTVLTLWNTARDSCAAEDRSGLLARLGRAFGEDFTNLLRLRGKFGASVRSALTQYQSDNSLRWTPLVGRRIRWNKVVGLAARETPIGLARPLQLFNFWMY